MGSNSTTSPPTMGFPRMNTPIQILMQMDGHWIIPTTYWTMETKMEWPIMMMMGFALIMMTVNSTLIMMVGSAITTMDSRQGLECHRNPTILPNACCGPFRLHQIGSRMAARMPTVVCGATLSPVGWYWVYNPTKE